MSNVLIVGAGGVSAVTIQKMAMLPKIFTNIARSFVASETSLTASSILIPSVSRSKIFTAGQMSSPE